MGGTCWLWNWDEWRLKDKGPSLVDSLGLSCQYKRFLFCLGCCTRPRTKYFFLTYTIWMPLSPSPQAGQAAVLGHLSLSMSLVVQDSSFLNTPRMFNTFIAFFSYVLFSTSSTSSTFYLLSSWYGKGIIFFGRINPWLLSFRYFNIIPFNQNSI